MRQLLFISLPLAVALTACGTVPRSSGAMQIGPDSYRVIARASLANTAGSQKMAFAEANEYCASMSRKMVTTNTHDLENSGYEVTFRCLKEGDPDLVRPMLRQVPNAVIEVR
jgi:hypothetical protein